VAAGVESSLRIVSGAGHGFQSEAEKREMVDFLKSRLLIKQ
jgi:hypothetical protein